MHRALLILALLAPGCAIQGEDIDAWSGIAGGSARLAGYLSDPERPFELRMRAAQALIQKGDLNYLLSALAQAEPADRAALTRALSASLRGSLAAEDETVRWRAITLAYALLEHPEPLGEELGPLAKALAERSLAELTVEKVPAWAATPDMALQGAAVASQYEVNPLIAAVASQDEVIPLIMAAAEQAANENLFLFLIALMRELRTPAVEIRSAQLLLARARAAFPAVSLGLARAMKENGSETLLLFLVELMRDTRLPAAVRDEGINASSRLGPKALPGLLRLVQTDLPPEEDYRMRALVALWERWGPDQLGAALRTLPPQGRWPSKGSELKDTIEGFCDQRLAEKPEAARPMLEGLVSDANWVARAFALACIPRLYPSEASALLKPLKKDKTPLPGWSESGEEMTFASAVAALPR